MIIKNGLVYTEQYTFEPLTLQTADDRITVMTTSDVCPSDDKEIFDASGCYVLPGLTDIHFHGCAGHDFCEGTNEAFEAIAAFELNMGTTSVCPATMTLPASVLSSICLNAAAFKSAQNACLIPTDTADLIGIHMEGPFINARKKGAQNEAYVIPANAALLRNWQKEANGLIRLISLAPEVPGAIDCIRECREEFRFSIAHTEADYETASAALQAGADHVTHLYNAMPPFTHRSPGVIGAAFDAAHCYAEIICDGVHISPAAVRAAFCLFGKERMILISDSMEAAGMPDGVYSLGGLSVQVCGNRAILADGTLAGSVTPLYQCMVTAVSMGIPLSDAVRAATINPCRSIGMDALYGSIAIGKKAHFLILDTKDLSIKAVLKNGKICG